MVMGTETGTLVPEINDIKLDLAVSEEKDAVAETANHN